ncbi:MAG: histidinol-phosphatase [Candidatus Daviesbacteria bacterium]|nr:histidinol-phosphatase [Candidatus Daviesbacteria bacterium]
MIFDSHVHTHYSHGDSEVYRVILGAIKKNIQGVGFSEHFHYNYFSDTGWPTINGNEVKGTVSENFQLYYTAAQKAKEEFKDKINILVGVEIDFLPGINKKIKAAIEEKVFKGKSSTDQKKGYEFDFIMGSTHFLGQPLKYFTDYKTQGEDWLINEYFNSIEEAIKSKLFDIIAHPELIKYYIDKKFSDYRQRIETIVKLLAEYQVAVDVNTDYLLDPNVHTVEVSRMNPGVEMIKLCLKNNIPLVLGSDAHRPEKIALNFEQTIFFLKKLGVKKMYYIQNRKLIPYKI